MAVQFPGPQEFPGWLDRVIETRPVERVPQAVADLALVPPPYTLLVAGSRSITDTMMVYLTLDHAIANLDVKYKQTLSIISGGANGVDSIAARYATANGYHFVEYPADWEGYGPAAGPIRNATMVKHCDSAVLFWDGRSKGTKNTFDLLGSSGKPYDLYCWPKYAARSKQLSPSDPLAS